MEIKLDKFILKLEESEKQARRLSDMGDFFADRQAVDCRLKTEDPVVYEVYSCGTDEGQTGDLSYAVTVINPGDIGGEYYMTKGHFHKKDVAEVYVCFEGSGILLMQDRAGRIKKSSLKAGEIFYVPKGFAHRAVNTGKGKLKFLAIYPSDSGHDYESIEKNGFAERIIKK